MIPNVIVIDTKRKTYMKKTMFVLGDIYNSNGELYSTFADMYAKGFEIFKLKDLNLFPDYKEIKEVIL